MIRLNLYVGEREILLLLSEGDEVLSILQGKSEKYVENLMLSFKWGEGILYVPFRNILYYTIEPSE